MKLLIIVIIALAGMFVVGAKTGIVDIPGLSPAKKASKAAQEYATDADGEKLASSKGDSAERAEAEPEKAAESPANEPGKQKDPVAVAPEIDPLAGEKSLAKIWKGLDAAAIASMISTWKDDQLVRQFAAMPPKQVGEVLALLPPERASKLSLLLQKQGVEDAKRAAKSEQS